MAALAMVGDTAALPRRRMPYPGPRQHERKLGAHLSARYCADPEQNQSQDVIPIEPGVRADRRYERLAPSACRLASTFGLSSSVRTMPCTRYRHQRGMRARSYVCEIARSVVTPEFGLPTSLDPVCARPIHAGVPPTSITGITLDSGQPGRSGNLRRVSHDEWIGDGCAPGNRAAGAVRDRLP